MALKIKGLSISLGKVFLLVALLVALTGLFFTTKTLSFINRGIEAARPANINIVKITAPGCADCFNIEEAILTLKKQNVLVGEEKVFSFDSEEVSSLIKELGITRVPTYIFTGEVSKKHLENFVKDNGEVKNNTFVFTKVPPVFLDPETKKEFGKVVATILTDASCPKCFDPKPIVESYQKAGIKITDIEEIYYNSVAGRKIVSRYKITKVPTFLFSSDIDFYDDIKNGWPNVGTIEQDKTYVVRNVLPPYRDISKGQIVGLVDVIYITDASCGDCYNAQQLHRPILTQGLNMVLRSESTIDANSVDGKYLISQYKITKVPTILLSPDAEQYTNFNDAWAGVGTIESDGWRVFREMQAIGDNIIYKDLVTNQVIKPASQSSGD